MDTQRDARELVSELHIFPHEAGYLAFHPETFSLFRLGATLGELLGDLRRGSDVATTALRRGIPPEELGEKLDAIRRRIESQAVERGLWGDEPPEQREVGFTLHVSNACNLGCLYCYAQGGDYGRKPQRRMDKGLALRAVDLMYQSFSNITSILFFGGEPLLALDVIEAVCRHLEERHARGEIAQLPEFKTVTNGTLIDAEAVRVIKRYKIRLTVSIDGPREIHDRLRPTKGGKGSYDAARRGFQRIVSEVGRIPQVEATYTRAHLDAGISMEALIGFLNREFLFTVGTVANVDVPPGHPLSLPIEEGRRNTEEALDHLMRAMAEGGAPKLKRSFLYPVLLFIKKRGTRFTCPVGYSGFDISTDGEIHPCQVFIGRPGFRMGTVDDFDAAAPSAEHLAVRQRLLYADKHSSVRCQSCWARPFCTNCPGSDLFARNDYKVPAAYCRNTRRWVESTLALLYEIRSNPQLWHNFLDGLQRIAREVEGAEIPPEVLAEARREAWQ